MAEINSGNSNGDAEITIKKNNAKVTDTLTLLFWYQVLDEQSKKKPQLVVSALPDNKGTYYFKIADLKKLGYFSISSRKTSHGAYVYNYFDQWLLESGDDILITLIKKDSSVVRVRNNIMNAEMNTLCNDYLVSFRGRGNEKFNCYMEAIKMAASIKGNFQSFNKGKYLAGNARDLVIHKSDSILLSYKNKLSPFIYQVMEMNLLAKHMNAKVNSFTWEWVLLSTDTLGKMDSLSVLYDRHLSNLGSQFIADTPKIYSNEWVNFIKSKESIHFYLQNRIYFTKRQHYRNDFYQYLKNKFTGEIRDRLLTSLLYSSYTSELMPSLLDALGNVSTGYCIDMLNEVMQSVATGMQVLNFKLEDTRGNMVSLEDYKGKVVFIDFWFTGCTSCVDYYKYTVSKVKELFKNNQDIVFVTISIDKEKKKWIKSVNGGEYTSTAAINLFTNGEGVAHPMIQGYRINGYPHPMIIDKKGNVYRFGGRELRMPDKLHAILLEAANSNI